MCNYCRQPHIIPLEEAGRAAEAHLADKSTARLGELRRQSPDVVPDGSVL